MQPAAGEQKKLGGVQGLEPEPVRVRLLGGFRVAVGSRTIGEKQWRLRKAANLVKLLALEPLHRLHREQVMELLWPELSVEAAANNLYRTLHFARKAFDAAPTSRRYMELRNEQLSLCPGGQLWVDVEAFKETAKEARRSREPAAYRAAIELYVGELLPEDRYEEWAEDRRRELRETYLALLAELAGLYERRGEYESAVEILRLLLSEEPLREEAHAGLMRIHALSGRRRQALERYELLSEVLRRELGMEPAAESRHLYEEILSGKFPPAQDLSPAESRDGRTHNLPAARTSFVGREREMVELKRMLSMTGLLTLTGTGGAGKTRLALEVARELVSVYPDGVWLVELAPLSDPELVAQQLARALGVREEPERQLLETLVEYLRKKKALLLLDNCEHLLDAVANLAGVLLGSCPRLKLLATSREPLGVASEATWAVPSLSVPGADYLPDPDNLARYESVRLFVDRTSAKLVAFALTPENARAVAEVCQKLDGVPLAIELAAARMAILTADQIAQRLDRTLGILTGGSRTVEPRHRTLRAALDWSYELLSEPERKLFGRLSVFAGGFTLEAVEAVGPGDGIEESEVLELFLMLVDKSLVVAEPDGEDSFRYGMLEPVRQYAREKLEVSSQAEQTLQRHAEYFLAFAEKAEPELNGPDQAAWLERLEREHDNLRAARRWLHESGQKEAGLRLAGALLRLWSTHGHLEEGQRWFEEALAIGDDSPSLARAKALNGAGGLAWQRGDLQRARAYLEQSLAVSQQLGDKPGMARALTNLANGISALGDHARAKELLERCLALDRELDDKRGIAYSLGGLGDIAFLQGEFAQAGEYYQQSLELHRKLGDKRSVALTLHNLGAVARGRGELQKAEAFYEQSLAVTREVDDRWLTVILLLGIGCLLASRNRTERAARVLGAAERHRSEIGFEFESSALADYDRAVERARAELGDQAFQAAWNLGRTMTLDEAADHALSKREKPDLTTGRSSDPQPAVLTRREREVAALIAQGLTNRQIAQELHLSKRTVDTHVTKILHKLGLHSRAHISDWVTQQQLPEQ